jgi:hypothetical protein
LWALRSPAARISIELCSTSDQANRTLTASAMVIVAAIVSVALPGAAHHRQAISGTISATVAASHGLRGPSLSIDAPRIGAVAITIQPAYCWKREISSWPRTGSPTSVAET